MQHLKKFKVPYIGGLVIIGMIAYYFLLNPLYYPGNSDVESFYINLSNSNIVLKCYNEHPKAPQNRFQAFAYLSEQSTRNLIERVTVVQSLDMTANISSSTPKMNIQKLVAYSTPTNPLLYALLKDGTVYSCISVNKEQK